MESLKEYLILTPEKVEEIYNGFTVGGRDKVIENYHYLIPDACTDKRDQIIFIILVTPDVWTYPTKSVCEMLVEGPTVPVPKGAPNLIKDTVFKLETGG